MGVEDDVFDTISAIYDAAINPSDWQRALESACQLSSSVGFNVFLLDHETGLVPFNTSVGIPDELLVEYNAHYVTKDPGIDFFIKNPDQDFYYNYLHTSEEDMNQHEYYRWLEEAGGARYYLAKTFDLGERYSIIATAQRDKKVGHAQHEDMKLLAQIGPHFQRAIQINQLFENADLRVATAYDALNRFPNGVFLIDVRGDIIFTNELARRILDQKDGVFLTKGRLSLGFSKEDTVLQKLVGEAVKLGLRQRTDSAGWVQASRLSGRKPYVMQVIPLLPGYQLFTPKQPVALIIVSDPENKLALQSDTLRLLYGLTQTEAEIAILLGQGARPAQICTERNISGNTLKTHRKRIFDKTGVETQSELVRVLNTL